MAMWNKNEQAYMQDNKTLFEAFLLADKNGNIINSFGVASNIPIAAGLVDGYGHINKFGATDGDVTAGYYLGRQFVVLLTTHTLPLAHYRLHQHRMQAPQ